MSNSMPLVSVICATYNQEKFISQCLEGILMQDTDFEFELIINDDASTDHTADIIREYEQKYDNIVAIYQKHNLWSQGFSIPRTVLYPRVRGKYVAICEGDDYWIDPLKLQKQVDYMEAHPEVSVCATEGYIYNQVSDKMSSLSTLGAGEYTPEQFLRENQIFTLSTLIRSDWLMEYQFKLVPVMPRFLMGDYPMWMFMLKRGKIVKLPDKCVVYRELEESASHTKNDFKYMDFVISSRDIQVYFNRLMKFNVPLVNYRRYRHVRRVCRRRARIGNHGFWTLYIYSLYRMLFHSKTRPTRKAQEVVREILK